jgi:hypothetical protein
MESTALMNPLGVLFMIELQILVFISIHTKEEDFAILDGSLL